MDEDGVCKLQRDTHTYTHKLAYQQIHLFMQQMCDLGVQSDSQSVMLLMLLLLPALFKQMPIFKHINKYIFTYINTYVYVCRYVYMLVAVHSIVGMQCLERQWRLDEVQVDSK